MSLSQDWIGEHPGLAGRLGVRLRERESTPALNLVDITVISLVLAFGALQFHFCERAKDFLYEDVFYADYSSRLPACDGGLRNNGNSDQLPVVAEAGTQSSRRWHLFAFDFLCGPVHSCNPMGLPRVPLFLCDNERSVRGDETR